MLIHRGFYGSDSYRWVLAATVLTAPDIAAPGIVAPGIVCFLVPVV